MINLKQFIKEKSGAMGLRPFVINMMLVVFCCLGIVSFVIFYLQANAPTNDLITNSSYGLVDTAGRLNQSLAGFTAATNNVSTTLGGSTPAPVQFIFLIFQAAFYIPKTIFLFMTSIPTIIMGIMFPALAATGLGAMVSIGIGLIGSIIIITLVFLVVKSIRSGESER
jgi:hypothetical protein